MRLHGASRVKRLVGCEVLEFLTVTDDSESEFGVNVIRRGDDVPLSVQEDDCVRVLWDKCVHIVILSYCDSILLHSHPFVKGEKLFCLAEHPPWQYEVAQVAHTR